MSNSGGPTRASALKMMGYEEDPYSGSELFTFHVGHLLEIAVLATLHCIGYPLLDLQADAVVYVGEDPIQASKCDAITKILGVPTIVSVKTAAYKMSGQSKGKWTRRGFASLPFEGIKKAKTGAYVHVQQELLGTQLTQSLIIVASKDIVKAFENDDYLGEKGNGSLTFYAELIKPDPQLQARTTKVISEQMDYVYDKKEAGPCFYLRSDTFEYVKLNHADIQPSNIWGGRNKEITGTFNPCGGCQMVTACRIAQ